MESNMKVEFDLGQVKLKEVKIGDIFLYQGEYYMKIGEAMSISVESWEICNFNPDHEEYILVQPKKSKLTILG